MDTSSNLFSLNYSPESVKNMVHSLDAIKKASPGSDVYGVLEKTAYHLSQMRSASLERNWKDAQKVMALNLSSLDLSKEDGKSALKSMLQEWAMESYLRCKTLRLNEYEHWKLGQAHLVEGFHYWDSGSIWAAWKKIDEEYQKIKF